MKFKASGAPCNHTEQNANNAVIPAEANFQSQLIVLVHTMMKPLYLTSHSQAGTKKIKRSLNDTNYSSETDRHKTLVQAHISLWLVYI